MDDSLSLHGGQVWLDGELVSADVSLAEGRVQAIGPALPEAATALDVSGQLVLPGLVDLHTHCFRMGFWGLNPEDYAAASGVTTWVDAGTAGAYTLDICARDSASAPVRIVPLLNISGIGLAGRTYESRFLDHVSVDDAVTAIQAGDGWVRGIKARIDVNTVGEHGLEPLRRAIEVAEQTRLPVMTHMATSPPTVPEILSMLRPGDIATHVAGHTPTGMLVDGQVADVAVEAHQRGVIFDMGHGMGGFTFEIGEELWRQDRAIDVLSTDLHLHSLATAVSLPQVMSKGLVLGMTLPEVLERVTSRPADALKLGDGIGRLQVGGVADVTVLSMVDEPLTVADVRGDTRTAPARFNVALTIMAGARLS